MTERPRIPNKAKRPPISSLKRTSPASLAKSYKTLPPLPQWQLDTKSGRVNGRANDPVLRAIDDLIKALGVAEDGAYLYLMGQLFFTTMSWLNNYNKSKQVVYTDRKPVLSLNLFAANELAGKLRCSIGSLATKLQKIYGIEMSPHGVNTDTAAVQRKYLSAAKREVYKVFMIQGRAFNYRTVSKAFKTLNSGLEGYRFVLSMSNELYATGAAGSSFSVKYHSSFMGGKPVQCAGDIWFDNGRVTKIKNSSGHYKPVDASLVKLLNYLRINGVSPRAVTVETVAFVKKGQQMVADERNSTVVKGDEFLRHNGNWGAILKRATHQRRI